MSNVILCGHLCRQNGQEKKKGKTKKETRRNFIILNGSAESCSLPADELVETGATFERAQSVNVEFNSIL